MNFTHSDWLVAEITDIQSDDCMPVIFGRRPIRLREIDLHAANRMPVVFIHADIWIYFRDTIGSEGLTDLTRVCPMNIFLIGI